MSDVLDILELDRDGGNEKKIAKKKRPPEQAFKKPEGMNREVYALLYSDNKDNAPLIPTDFGISSKLGLLDYGYKKAKANLGLRKVRKWSWMQFINPSRNDGFELSHWRREVDKNKEYPFGRMHITTKVPEYTDSEYRELLQNDNWTRGETDYLMRMCQKYDLRFVVIEDKWDRSSYNNRSVEDLKDRYYAVCNSLNKLRNEPPRSDPNFANVKPQICVFDAEHERKRKEQLIKLYNRTPEEVEEEQQLIAELRKIEQRKKEREKKTQDLQKLITAADSTTELRRNEQQAQARASTSLSRSSRKKTQSQVKGSRVSDVGTVSLGTPNFESASIKFPDPKASGIYLRSSRMKLPSSVGQKRVKAINQLLNELKIEQHPLPNENICQHFNDLRSDMVLLYELKIALSNMEFEIQSLKHQAESTSDSIIDKRLPPPTPLSTPMMVQTSSGAGPALFTSNPKDESATKKISEVIDVNTTPRKRKAAMESENFMRKISRKS